MDLAFFRALTFYPLDDPCIYLGLEKDERIVLADDHIAVYMMDHHCSIFNVFTDLFELLVVIGIFQDFPAIEYFRRNIVSKSLFADDDRRYYADDEIPQIKVQKSDQRQPFNG